MQAQPVLSFWFDELHPEQWWRVDPALDAEIRRRFATTHAAANRGELWRWRDAPPGRLAEVIVLDQFSRNMFRGDARAFASDPLALALAQEAVRAGSDRSLPVEQRCFLYLPFTHSESLAIHDVAMQLFDQPGLEENLGFEIRHRKIVERFGRYPHRNRALGRTSTPEEEAFLKEPDSSF